eukprot:166662-Rhodomonas_salina.2
MRRATGRMLPGWGTPAPRIPPGTPGSLPRIAVACASPCTTLGQPRRHHGRDTHPFGDKKQHVHKRVVKIRKHNAQTQHKDTPNKQRLLLLPPVLSVEVLCHLSAHTDRLYQLAPSLIRLQPPQTSASPPRLPVMRPYTEADLLPAAGAAAHWRASTCGSAAPSAVALRAQHSLSVTDIAAQAAV